MEGNQRKKEIVALKHTKELNIKKNLKEDDK
jgi:hypothetical protein